VATLSNKLQEENIGTKRESCMRTETTKSKQTPHEPDISEKMRLTAESNEPKFQQQNRAWSTLKWFDGTAKTEAAFYIRFQTLPDEDVTFLKSTFAFRPYRTKMSLS
jgi:hypothetical protein